MLKIQDLSLTQLEQGKTSIQKLTVELNKVQRFTSLLSDSSSTHLNWLLEPINARFLTIPTAKNVLLRLDV